MSGKNGRINLVVFFLNHFTETNKINDNDMLPVDESRSNKLPLVIIPNKSFRECFGSTVKDARYLSVPLVIVAVSPPKTSVVALSSYHQSLTQSSHRRCLRRPKRPL